MMRPLTMPLVDARKFLVIFVKHQKILLVEKQIAKVWKKTLCKFNNEKFIKCFSMKEGGRKNSS